MLPDHPYIFTCPHCGGEKKLLRLASGNTFGALYWSDNKMEARMMPSLSFVQRCPHCGKYFIIDGASCRNATEGYCMDTGELTWDEMKEAFRQLSEEGFTDEEHEANVRILLLHTFNDFYHRSNEGKAIDDADARLFRDNALWLAKNFGHGLLVAEIYREAGMMEEAQKELVSVEPANEFEENIKPMIQEHIDNHDTAVFLLNEALDA
jgi:predicted RNA-binding Zn-ribbon protein involved in translation (DUF1610 family)